MHSLSSGCGPVTSACAVFIRLRCVHTSVAYCLKSSRPHLPSHSCAVCYPLALIDSRHLCRLQIRSTGRSLTMPAFSAQSAMISPANSVGTARAGWPCNGSSSLHSLQWQTPLALFSRRLAQAMSPGPRHGSCAVPCWPAVSSLRPSALRAFSRTAEDVAGITGLASTSDSSLPSHDEPARALPQVVSGTVSKAPAIQRQTVDFTMLAACAQELARDWTPAKIEEVHNADIPSHCS